MAFLPLSQQMEKRNSAYYKSASTRIHDDFLTYAQNPKGALPRACALDFHNRNCGEDEEEKPLRILEIGVGEGNFALGFMSELEKMDKKSGTDLSERAAYFLADFSPHALAKARKKLSVAGFAAVEECEFDAAGGEFPPEIAGMEFDGIFCNELFSDLPSEMYVRKGGKVFEVDYDDKMKAGLVPPGPVGNLASVLLEKLPGGFFIPINGQAAKSASAIAKLLSKGGAFDIFDYGFYLAGDFDIPAQMWNSNIVREYGGQWTVDLNFIFMSALLRGNGFDCAVEPQENFAAKVSGEEVGLSQGKNGLDYAKRPGNGISESDSFYHMRVRK